VLFRKLGIEDVSLLGMMSGRVWKLEFMRVVNPNLIGGSLNLGELGTRLLDLVIRLDR
jgi:hypothetical protein